MSRIPDLPVPEAALDDLRRRLEHTRWGAEWPEQPWAAGTDAATLRRLADYWRTGFDWRAVESRILALNSVITEVRGTPVHAFVFEAETPGALAVVLTNGWPSTSYELVHLAERLSMPSRFGGDPSHALTIVVPSLPGFPFSPQRPERASEIHELWHELMGSMGYPRYGAHGGDLGAGITSRLAQAHPEAVVGIHLMAVAAPIDLDESTLSADERRFVERARSWSELEGSYQHQQQRRPLSLSPALSDSPVGLLAWIVEKYRAWSDSDGELNRHFSDDFLLTQASLYWFTNSISTSLRPYYEYAAGLIPPIRRVTVPTAVAVFPADLAQPPREWAERTYTVARYTTMPRGGHFAPHEEPELIAADISEFFASLVSHAR
ncbi:epoxide hydrolase family protein [Agreia sp. COWG]|uniref:epoxide hydrolase family protein n=1 Tax=Agreia sp. COWG TaxID=2773266 RepID=UPI0019273418|nr:epoxide hydrolase family protein [Agreia sp. COWG]CAD6011213.1 Hydrolase [Agreia sp. COWG]